MIVMMVMLSIIVNRPPGAVAVPIAPLPTATTTAKVVILGMVGMSAALRLMSVEGYIVTNRDTNEEIVVQVHLDLTATNEITTVIMTAPS